MSSQKDVEGGLKNLGETRLPNRDLPDDGAPESQPQEYERITTLGGREFRETGIEYSDGHKLRQFRVEAHQRGETTIPGGTFEVIEYKESTEPIKVGSQEEAGRLLIGELKKRHAIRHGKDGISPKVLHASEHPELVGDKTGYILAKIKQKTESRAPQFITDKGIIVAKAAGVGHDIKIHQVKVDGAIDAQLQRVRGTNPSEIPANLNDDVQRIAKGLELNGSEGDSANEIIALMQRFVYESGPQSGERIFSDEEIIPMVKGMVGVTYPDFRFIQVPNAPKGTFGLEVKQTYLTAESSVYDLTIALSDLNSQTSATDGNLEFRELRYKVQNEISTRGIDNLTPDEMSKIFTACIEWQKTQPNFLRFRKILGLEAINNNKQIATLGEDDAEAVRALFKEEYGLEDGGLTDTLIADAERIKEHFEKDYGPLRDELVTHHNKDQHQKGLHIDIKTGFIKMLEEVGWSAT